MSDARDMEAQRGEVAPLITYFSGFLPDLGVRPEALATIEESHEAYLELLDANLFQHPYHLGGGRHWPILAR
jgi:hypothetical protein